MHVVTHIADRKIEFDLTYDPSFIADVNTQAVLRHYGTCEPEVMNLMVRVLREGDVAIDVGANIGFFTIVMSKLVGPTGHVLAFEPGPQNNHKLAANLLLNKCGNVNVQKSPLWSEETTVTLYLSNDSGLDSLAPCEQTVSSIEMRAAVLDSYCRSRVPRLIKIDAEGSEEHILRGAEAVLDRDVPFITCELNEAMLARLGSSERSLRHFMGYHGYSTFLLRPDGSIPVHVPPATTLKPTSTCSNILFSTLLDVGLAWPEVAV